MFSESSINDLLPGEILGEMFLHCIPQNPLRYPQPQTTIPPMVLCHVCSSWREIALRTPRLWKHLCHVVRLSESKTSVYAGDLVFLRWWKENVKDIPIALRLEFTTYNRIRRQDYQYVELDDFLQFLGILLLNVRYLHLNSEYQKHAPFFRGFDTPLLDTIVFSGETAPFRRFEALPVNPKQHLCRVFVQDVSIWTDDLSSNLDFSLITHLHLNMATTLDIWFLLLHECVNLTQASFFVSLHGPFDHPTQFHTVLHHLQQLHFRNLGPELHRSFLDGVHLPSLIALSLEHFKRPGIEHLHRILSSMPNLRTLQLQGTDIRVREPQTSFFIDGDLDVANPSLSEVVPYLSSIHFLYSRAAADLFVPQNRDLAISALTGPWLQVGRPGNRLSTIFIGDIPDGPVRKTVRNEVNEKMGVFVTGLQTFLPLGISFSVASSDDWHQKYTSQFEYLLLDDLE